MKLNPAQPNEYVVISEYDTRKVIDTYEFQKMERFSFRGIFVSMFVKSLVSHSCGGMKS